MNCSCKLKPGALKAAALLALGTILTAGAASAATLPSKVLLRPLTPQDIKDYALTGQQGANGLSTIGVGQAAYLEALVAATLRPSNIVSVTWSLASKPLGSTAELAPSPLGTNVPPHEPADRRDYQVGSRTFLRPDLEGSYSVTATIKTTELTTNLTQTITAARFLGWSQGCIACHSGGLLAPDMSSWTNTRHASMLTRNIDDVTGHYGKNCISCHTVGYDANTNAVNGGFDDVAKDLGWTFPATITPTNWASMPDALKNLSNIQCENCHGPGSQHVFSGGVVGNTAAISVNWDSGNCSQCHNSLKNHYRSAEWTSSRHAVATRTPSGPTRPACVRCHTATGLVGYLEHRGSSSTYATNTVYEPITCAACHDPHSVANPHQLRAGDMITLDCGVTVTNAGRGGFCMNCHQSRTGAASNSIEKYPKLLPTWAGGSSFGPHDNPAADMLEGVNGWTYGKEIPSSAHRFAVEDTCVGCHMQPVDSTNPAFTKAGGHTWNMAYSVVSGGATNTVDLVNVCVECHGPISSFDMVKVDYNGDGVIEGVQTEVQRLLEKVNTLLPDSTYRADGNYVSDGLVNSVSVKTNWQSKFLKAAWNYQFVNNDLSKGVHNAAYAVGLLKASIADLTGDANTDGLPDEWQIKYFGSTTSPNAAPNASPAGDGIPNWLKWTLGLDPMVAGLTLPDGVVWANAGPITGSTDTIRIYTAAEVVFDTEVGKTYQLEAISTLGGGWTKVGAPINGTGAAVSYVTPTRTKGQQFYRVVTNP